MPKTEKELWFGIDPGLVRTGIVCATPELVLEYATYAAGVGPDFCRVIALAQAIVEFCEECLYVYGDANYTGCSVSIELPIYKRNPKTLIKQSRLLEEIESQLFNVSGGRDWYHLYEISPTQSKLAATGSGNATKAQIIEVCPLGGIAPFHDMHIDDQEAVADAWAHYKAGITGKYENYYDLGKLQMGMPVPHERTL